MRNIFSLNQITKFVNGHANGVLSLFCQRLVDSLDRRTLAVDARYDGYSLAGDEAESVSASRIEGLVMGLYSAEGHCAMP